MIRVKQTIPRSWTQSSLQKDPGAQRCQRLHSLCYSFARAEVWRTNYKTICLVLPCLTPGNPEFHLYTKICSCVKFNDAELEGQLSIHCQPPRTHHLLDPVEQKALLLQGFVYILVCLSPHCHDSFRKQGLRALVHLCIPTCKHCGCQTVVLNKHC